MKNKILIGTVLALSAAFTAPAFADGTQLAKGKDVYTNTCQTCHGEKLDGNGEAGKYMSPKPRNLVSDKFKNGDNVDAIFKTVTDGLKDTAMVGFSSLPEVDRKAVAEYVASLRKK